MKNPSASIFLLLSIHLCSTDAHAQESASPTPLKDQRDLHLPPSIAAPPGPQEPEAPAPPDPSETVVIRERAAPPRFLPPIDGVRLFSGKKTTVTELRDLPQVTNSNHRQALALTPGLLVSEVANGSWASFSYRGLGEPHESWNLLLLKDGVPVGPDPYSYPAAYYTPPLESVERIEFVRGGAALLYGPLPGGALNYVTRRPRQDESFSLNARALYGSFNLFTGYAAAQGTVGRVGYLVDLYHSRSDGPRAHNSDLWTLQGNAVVTIDAGRATRYLARFDAYGGDFGEPGGLTLARYREDRAQISTPADRFRARRYVASFQVDRDLGAHAALELRAFGGFYDRESRRQAGTRFGELAPDANVSIVQRQRFGLFGASARGRTEWGWLGERHTLSAGLWFFGSDAPVQVDKGDRRDDDEGRGDALSRADRRTVAAALFLENQFRAGRLRLTPGLRVELLHQSVRETLDLAVGAATSPLPGAENGPLGDRSSLAAVLLPGVGAAVDLGPVGEVYGNLSRGYKPRLFNDGVTFQAGLNVAGTFEASYATVAEAGLRGRPTPWLSFDTSAFFLTYDDQIGLLGNDSGGATRRNLGPLQSYGWDALVELDPLALVGAIVEARAPARRRYLGDLNLFAGVSLLSARFQRGPVAGGRPGYAPAYQLRTGAAYRYRERVKAALTGTIVADHSGVDNGHRLFAIPGYMVWDLSADVAVYKHYLGLTGGVNNLFDKDYYARVRPGGGGGIDPAPRRNFYVGLSGRY